MNIIGIISEYNPFHAGHLYHINQTRKQFPDSVLVALMSGYFVQRGEPAILSKWDRAKVAVRNGVNLVIELPTFFATSAAPDFAKGAMTLLKQIGATHFSFGSEIEDIETLRHLSAHTQSEEFRIRLKRHLELGHSYAAASIRAGAPVLPNSILASEYLKHAEGLEPILIPRNSNHSDSNLYPENSEEKSENVLNASFGIKTPISAVSTGTPDEALATKIPLFSSAKAIRNAIQTCYRSDVGSSTLQRLTGIDYSCICASESASESASTSTSASTSGSAWNSLSQDRLDALLLYRIRSASPEELRNTRGMSEGFENRLKESASLATTTEQLISLAETKRFPLARIRRILISILLQIPSENTHELNHPSVFDSVDYIRVLAFDETGRKLLSRLKEKPRSKSGTLQEKHLEIIAKLSKSQNKNPLFALDQRAASIYATLTGTSDSEYRKLPYIH